jgi:hypothetical protein
MGKGDDEIRILEIDCWHYIRNVWFGNMTKQMNRALQEVLRDQLSDLPLNYRIQTNIFALLHAIENEYTKTANYAKGHGDEFQYCIKSITVKCICFLLLKVVVAVNKILNWKDVRLCT